MSATSSSGKLLGSIIAGSASVLVLLAAGLLLLNKQFITDQISVWSYTPTSAVETISSAIDLSDKGQFYFYTTQPVVAAADTFNQGCPRQEPSSPILGCYTGDRIYIYDVTNQQLNGIEEVTAAHEMLHAAWDRVSDADKQWLTKLLQDEYEMHATPELETRIAYYERNEPGQVVNELHSILPTEVATLSPELETYYQKYFKDRQKIVAFHDQYNGVLTQLVDQLKTLQEDLTTLSASIESATETYNAKVTALSASISSFNDRARNEGFSSQQEFNNERSALLAQAAQLEISRNAINVDIDRYNETYTQYQEVGSQLDSLNKSIDSISNLPQIPSIEE